MGTNRDFPEQLYLDFTLLYYKFHFIYVHCMMCPQHRRDPALGFLQQVLTRTCRQLGRRLREPALQGNTRGRKGPGPPAPSPYRVLTREGAVTPQSTQYVTPHRGRDHRRGHDCWHGMAVR